MSHLTDAQNMPLNSAILEAVRRDLELRWQRRRGAFHIVELVSVFTKFNGTERTRRLYCTDSPVGHVSADTITRKVRLLGGTINDPQPVFQQKREDEDF